LSVPLPTPALYIGLMSGTSLDGVDGVLAEFPIGASSAHTHAYVPFPAALRADLLALQTAGDNEIHREALMAQTLTHCYAACVGQLLAHGQTVRHRPELGYTRQINNPALLAELTKIDVIADFRSRDIAAGGQGAPLVPAFHQAVFGAENETRVVLNIGGISNISILEHGLDWRVVGFDTGPGNVLMDAWIAQHRGAAYDAEGDWASAGIVNAALLESLRDEAYFALPPPKSTGRDLFHPAWLATKLTLFSNLPAVDVQATLAAFTAATIADAIANYAADAQAVYVCGGGAYNTHLLLQLQHALGTRKLGATLHSTQKLGIAPNQVEALAFAWLAQRHLAHQPGNLPSVTGARGRRILGALYPA
jgi:anhydro-N-acetylmuramic acid kinase